MRTFEVEYIDRTSGEKDTEFTFDEKTVKELYRLGFEDGCSPCQFKKDVCEGVELWLYAEQGNKYTLSCNMRRADCKTKSLASMTINNFSTIMKAIQDTEALMVKEEM